MSDTSGHAKFIYNQVYSGLESQHLGAEGGQDLSAVTVNQVKHGNNLYLSTNGTGEHA